MAFFGRGKNKVQNPYTLKDFFIFYNNEVNENRVYKVEYSEYVAIVSEFYKRMMDYVLLESGKIYLPFGMGEVRVVKLKHDLDSLDHKQLDWKTTVTVGKRVYHLNEHSGGYKYIFEWSREGSAVKRIALYRFQLTREHKRRLAKLIKSGEQDYYEKK